VFEELRGVLTAEPEGPFTRDAYLELGVRQSLFDKDQRAALFDVFARYQVWLRDNQYYEPNLVAHEWIAKVKPCYDFIAVDEVQDLTNAQLALVLASLKRPGQFVIAGDANQIVHPNYFSWSKVKSLFWRGIGEVGERQVHMLTASYRNSPQVTAVANDVLRLKHLRFGSLDKESNQLMRAVGGAAGQVAGFPLGSTAVHELDQRTRQSNKVAVVVLRDEHKAEARQRFHTPLLFSIREAKGLECESVVLYRLVANERALYAELAEGVQRSDLTKTELDYRRGRDKFDKSSEVYKFFVNALYVGLTRAVRDVYFVEDDVRPPLLGLLGVAEARDAAGVEARTATAQEWQAEAQRLEAQGKREQAEAIRRDVLHLKPVPWPVFDAAHLPELLAKARDGKVVSQKARQQLLEFAHLHDETVTVFRLAQQTGVGATRAYEVDRKKGAQEAIQRALGKGLAAVLRDTEVYGVDHRTQVGLAPLMMAAYTGNIKLVEALRERGADPTIRDHLGRMALHWALRGAWDGFLQPNEALGEIYDRVAPPSFDIEVDGCLMQVGREKGEYFLFHLMVARLSELYEPGWSRAKEFTADFLSQEPREALPEVVVKARRKKRQYLNHLLARACVGSKYVPCRQLWVRRHMGCYVLNPALKLRVTLPDGTQAWQPLPDVVRAAWLDEQLKATRTTWRPAAPVPPPSLPPLTPKQLAAARAMAPGIGTAELDDMRRHHARPLAIGRPPPIASSGAFSWTS
jgi:uncharacterized membrane protein